MLREANTFSPAALYCKLAVFWLHQILALSIQRLELFGNDIITLASGTDFNLVFVRAK